MKFFILLAALLISIVSWFLTSPKTKVHRLAIHRPIQRIIRTILIGIATYFILVALAMIYLYYANV